MELVQLSNGIDGLFIENKRFKTTLVSFNFFLPLENSRKTAENSLLTYILSSCSNKLRDFTDINLALNDLYGADIEATVNKIGDTQHIKLAVVVVNDEFSLDKRSVINDATNLLLSLIFDPKIENESFFSEDIEREKRKLTEHILGEINDKRLYARGNLISEMFCNEPFGVSRYGNKEDLEQINGHDLYNAWQNLLKKSYIRVQIVGNKLPQNIFENIKNSFSLFDRNFDESILSYTPLKPCNEVKRITDNMDITQGKLVLGFSSDLYGVGAYALNVATDIFGGGPYSLLFENVREKMSLCYYCSAGPNKLKGYVIVDSGVESQNAEKAEKEILNQLENIKNGEFSDFAFEASIKNLTSSLDSYYDSLFALDSWYSTNVFSDKLETPESVKEKIKSITRQDVVSAINGVKLHTVYRLLPEENN